MDVNLWRTRGTPRPAPGPLLVKTYTLANCRLCKHSCEGQIRSWKRLSHWDVMSFISLFASSTTDMESFYFCLQKTAKTTVSAWTHEQSHCKRITVRMRVYKIHVIIQITLHTSFMKAWSVGFKWKLVSLKAPQRCQQLKWFNWNKHNKPCSFFCLLLFYSGSAAFFFLN